MLWVRLIINGLSFCTHLQTKKVGEIRKKANVHISLGAKDLETAKHWLQVEGRAEISTDKTERHSFWFDELSNYFTGPDDPNYCVIIVRPSRIEFGTNGDHDTRSLEGGQLED